MTEIITVKIVYPNLEKQDIFSLELPIGSTIAEAIQQSGILNKCPEIDLTKNKIGIFSKLSKLDTLLRNNDRIEIYRPLIADPKAIRQQRVAGGKLMKKNSGEL